MPYARETHLSPGIFLSLFHVNWRRIIIEINVLEIEAATATVLTAETEGLLDHEVYNGKAAEKVFESKEASAV